MIPKRLTLRRIREILRLKYEVRLSTLSIALDCKISNNIVGEYLRRAKAAGLSWLLAV